MVAHRLIKLLSVLISQHMHEPVRVRLLGFLGLFGAFWGFRYKAFSFKALMLLSY